MASLNLLTFTISSSQLINKQLSAELSPDGPSPFECGQRPVEFAQSGSGLNLGVNAPGALSGIALYCLQDLLSHIWSGIGVGAGWPHDLWWSWFCRLLWLLSPLPGFTLWGVLWFWAGSRLRSDPVAVGNGSKALGYSLDFFRPVQVKVCGIGGIDRAEASRLFFLPWVRRKAPDFVPSRVEVGSGVKR